MFLKYKKCNECTWEYQKTEEYYTFKENSGKNMFIRLGPHQAGSR